METLKTLKKNKSFSDEQPTDQTAKSTKSILQNKTTAVVRFFPHIATPWSMAECAKVPRSARTKCGIHFICLFISSIVAGARIAQKPLRQLLACHRSGRAFFFSFFFAFSTAVIAFYRNRLFGFQYFVSINRTCWLRVFLRFTFFFLGGGVCCWLELGFGWCFLHCLETWKVGIGNALLEESSFFSLFLFLFFCFCTNPISIWLPTVLRFLRPFPKVDSKETKWYMEVNLSDWNRSENGWRTTRPVAVFHSVGCSASPLAERQPMTDREKRTDARRRHWWAVSSSPLMHFRVRS